MSEDINYNRIEKAIQYLIANFKKQPSLEELAQHIGLSNFHFQRIFKEWAGVSPKKFLEYLTLEALKQELSGSFNLIEAAEQVGLSSQSRVYDLFVKIEAMTPQEYRDRGKGLTFEYGFSPTPFGECFISFTPRGINEFQFIDNNREELISSMKQEWHNANFNTNNAKAKETINQIFYSQTNNKPLTLWLKGTSFQLKVWQALLNIPSGNITTYSKLAEQIGNPKATRAVASAVANNPVGYIIPCPRVIRSEGIIGQYHWKSERKASIIGWEKCKKHQMHI